MRAPQPPSAVPLLFQDREGVDRALEKSLEAWHKLPVRGCWLVNSHPKSGTHLLRNVLLHFNSAAVSEQILFYDSPLDPLTGAANAVCFAHLPYSLFAALPQRSDIRPVLLLRHPCAIALALARAFFDVNTTRPDQLYLREHASFEEIVRKVVYGYEFEGLLFGPLADSLAEFCTNWLFDTDCIVRFEEIVAHLGGGSDSDLVEFFRPLLERIYGEIPGDAAARIRIGASPALSATYSRTAPRVYDRLRPEDVYALLPSATAELLRSIAVFLGY